MSNRAQPPRRIVGISGNLTRPSKTRTLVSAILHEIEEEGLGNTEVLDIIDAGPELGTVVDRAGAPFAPAQVLEAIERADALVVATPVYKAAYTGLFKHLFDLIDPKVLEGRPIILAATGRSDRHSLVIDHHLRPLFAFFRAHAVPCGIYATHVDFNEAGELTDVARQRITPAVDQLALVLGGVARTERPNLLARIA